MKKYIKQMPIALLLILTVIYYGCDDFIEKDLENKEVKILVPADNSKISTTTVTFWWEKVDGALEYNVQVVSPSFDRAQKLWVDSVVVDNKLMLSLAPGNFEWRIKALNGSSESDFVTAAFSIDSTLNLPYETIILLLPEDKTASNNPKQIFRWSILFGADDYNFKIFNAANEPLEDIITFKTEASYEFLEDGDYTWMVRGQNDLSNTPYSSFTLQIDTKSPGKPTLNTPTLVGDSVYFTWSRAADNGSPLYDSLYVFADEELTQKKLAKKVEQPSCGDLFEEPGTYHWYVKTCDVAGNVGERSDKSSFTKY